MKHLSDHKLRKHSDSNPCCRICEKVFSSIINLRVHNKRIHVKSEVDCLKVKIDEFVDSVWTKLFDLDPLRDESLH